MDDLISRQAAIDALADYIHNVDKVMGTGHLTADDCKDAAASVFEELPSAQPDRRKGKWIGEPKDGIEAMFFKPKCSVCGFESAEVKNFCPNCGSFNGGVE